MRRIVRPILFVFLMFPSLVSAQTIDERIKSLLAQIEKGQVEDARKRLPDLIAMQPNNPGVLYLQGRLASNGTEGMKSYQSIVDNFPKSEWADDALYAIYQYYYALGLYKTANLKLQELKKEYPASPFASDTPPVAATHLTEETVNLPKKEMTVISESTKAVEPPVVQPPEPYTLQVGAFSTVANAEKQKNLFEELGMTVEVTNKVRGGRSLYLVWVGSFRTADEAKEAGKDIKKKHRIDSIIVERY